MIGRQCFHQRQPPVSVATSRWLSSSENESSSSSQHVAKAAAAADDNQAAADSSLDSASSDVDASATPPPTSSSTTSTATLSAESNDDNKENIESFVPVPPFNHCSPLEQLANSFFGSVRAWDFAKKQSKSQLHNKTDDLLSRSDKQFKKLAEVRNVMTNSRTGEGKASVD